MQLDIAPDFSGAGLVLALVIAAYLAVLDPWLGRRMYADLKRRREHDAGALTRYYTQLIAAWVALGALAGAALLLSPGVSAADAGLVAPKWSFAGVAVVGCFCVAIVLGTVQVRKLAAEGRNVPGLADVEPMLPRTPAERRLALAVAVVDGVCGSLVYRGLLIALFADLTGSIHLAAALSVVVLSLAGLYQGASRIPLFAFVAVGLTALYLVTGSLLVVALASLALTARDLLALAPVTHPHPNPETV
ncbi:CPBP family intramembrane metalloprotease [Streptomyces sp. A7024]|uniref:CPBP family intramembrane metalloprotease n=1 Tax=Streptomyces coryli TaxID=1128680 RepID=A0A6G4TWZ4_9ACTN|nr:CPBP family intramembrane glutamic endopeptidase [Streptomyces coryli]NGN64040.1 CPBP family intramembrane metalloprotease [Streptomyces coryli]